MSNCLKLSNADLHEVPTQARQEGWVRVDLSCNQLEQVTPGSISGASLVELRLSNNKFTELPSGIAALTVLTKLELSSNFLTSLCTSLTQLAKLKHLVLARNRLDDVSVVIGCLTALEHLDLSHNVLRSSPVSSKILNQLSSLDLSRNCITYLHKSIGQCSKLVCLKVAHNRLRTYPSSLCNCKNLEHLDFSNNSLMALQGRVYEWTSLRHLDLSNNELILLPSAIGWLSLETLCVEGNPKIRIPSQVTNVPEPRLVWALLTYQQIVCEQHRLIENHLGQFSVKAGFQLPDDFIKADPCRAFSARRRRDEEYTACNITGDAVTRARMHGLLDFRCCGITSLPPNLATSFATQPIRVLDARYNKLHSAVPASALESLLILNLAHNELETVVSAKDHRWIQLAVLNLSFNSLRSLPPSLGNAQKLQQLYAANNQLEALPQTLGSLPLVDLFLSENSFRTFPPCVCSMKFICKLSIACNNLTVLPEALGAMTTLQFLDVSFNNLTTLPSTLAHLTQLEAFNGAFNPLGFPQADTTKAEPNKQKALSGKRLKNMPAPSNGKSMTSLPANVGDLPPSLLCTHSLRELNLDHTGCRNIDHRLGKLSNLRALQMEGNEMEQPWLSIYKLDPILLVYMHSPTLNCLDISGCGLTSLPDSMAAMRSLKSLNISNNSLVTLPRVLGKLPVLEALCVDGNPLAPHLAGILQRGQAQGPGIGEGAIKILLSVHEPALQLTDLCLTTLPQEVYWHCDCLTYLDLQSNQLEDLPQAMSMLQHLCHLNLDNNKLLVLPKAVYDLRALRVLQVANNSISLVPESITQLRKLGFLALGDNSPMELPDALSNLKSLVGLSVPNSHLTSFSPCLCNLPALKVLDLSGNHLTTLPGELTNLTSLKSLRISLNDLVSVPPGLTALKSLVGLSVRDNPVSMGVTNVQARSRPDVLQLLQELRARSQDAPVADTAGHMQALKRNNDAGVESTSACSRPKSQSRMWINNQILSLITLLHGEAEIDQDNEETDYVHDADDVFTSTPVVRPPEQTTAPGTTVDPYSSCLVQHDPGQVNPPPAAKDTSPDPPVPSVPPAGASRIPVRSQLDDGPVNISPDLLEVALGGTQMYSVTAPVSGAAANHSAGASEKPGPCRSGQSHTQMPEAAIATRRPQYASPEEQTAAQQTAHSDPHPSPSTILRNPIKSVFPEQSNPHTAGEEDHELLFASLLSVDRSQPAQPGPQLHQPRPQSGTITQQVLSAPAASPTPHIQSWPQDPTVLPVAIPLQSQHEKASTALQKGRKQAARYHDAHTPDREQDASPLQQQQHQEEKAPLLQQQTLQMSMPSKAMPRTPTGAPRVPQHNSPRDMKIVQLEPENQAHVAQADENSFVLPYDQVSQYWKGHPVPAGVKAAAPPSLHSTWGLRTCDPQAGQNTATRRDGASDGDRTATAGLNVTLARLRTPLSAARHEQRQQRWLDMAGDLHAGPVPVEDQVQPAIDRQLSPNCILNSLKKAQHPPQLNAVGAMENPQAAPEGYPQGGRQRPTVRKRFERVMASQIATLNQLISSAAAHDPQIS